MGIVYVLKNAAFPDLLKIGCTAQSIKKRITALNRGMPDRYYCVAAWEFDDHIGAERALHAAFEDYRFKNNREFFEVSPVRVIALLEQFGARSVPLDEEAQAIPAKEAVPPEPPPSRKKRRGHFRFSMVGISPGDVLFSVWDARITCTVVDDQRVEFGGGVMSLSAAAKLVARGRGNSPKALQGPAYWRFGDPPRTLAVLRDLAGN